MPNLKGKHPNTGRPNADYVTIVIEHKPGDPAASATLTNLCNNLLDEDSAPLPGYRVIGVSFGNALNEKDNQNGR